MKRKVIFGLFLITVLVLSIALCACGGTQETKKKTESKTDSDGWSKINSIDESEVYMSLISGCQKVILSASKESIQKVGYLTVDAAAKVTIGDTERWVNFIGKYKPDKPRESTVAGVELSNAEKATEESKVMSAYVYDDTLYINLADKKISLPLENTLWPNYFPMEMKEIASSTLGNLCDAMEGAVSATVTGQKRNNSGMEYKYNIDINIPESLSGLFTEVLPLMNDKSISDLVKKFITGLFGVEEADIAAGNIPESELAISFTTKNSVISDMKAEFKMDTKNSKLFVTDELELVIDLSKLSFNETAYNQFSVPFVNDEDELAEYVPYFDAIYTANFKLDEYDENDRILLENANLKITTSLFKDNPEDDYLFVEYHDHATGAPLKAVYFYKSNVYFYDTVDEEYTCLCAFNIGNFSQLAINVFTNKVGGTSKPDIYDMMVYILRSVSIEDGKVGVSVTPDFYEKVWFNYDDVCNYANTLVEEDLGEVEGLVEYRNFVKNNQIIMKIDLKSKDLMIQDPDNAQYIDEVTERLDTVTDFLTPVTK